MIVVTGVITLPVEWERQTKKMEFSLFQQTFHANKYLHKENTNEIIIRREKPLQALYKANNKCTSKVGTSTSHREIAVEPRHTTNELSTQQGKTYRERNKGAEAPRLDASVYNTIAEFIVDTERRRFT
uniref:Uncharacterized protein n=1 Tax=Glossina pallidipes TaxID=7398 RepID=A0A1B0ACA2_GLOPL